jgi:prepilin-type processing-associated H-X9-DG protein
VDHAVKLDIQPDRHFDAANYLYADGHVDVISAATIDEWIAAGTDFGKPE